jgi:methionyl aminopeptidase
MVKLKTPEDIKRLRRAGKVLAGILDALEKAARPGVTTQDLDDEAMQRIEGAGAEPILLGYKPNFADRPYPAAMCTSINNVVQHGVPGDYVLKEGDVANLDLSIGYDGMVVDSGRTIGVGNIDKRAKELINVTREALYIGIEAAQVGGHIGDIGDAVARYVRAHGFSIVEELCGHGVGYAVHEEPMVPNFGKKGTGPLIEPGLVIAIEPIVNEGGKHVIFDDAGDGYTVRTADGSRSAHFEHTVAITKDGPEILTI